MQKMGGFLSNRQHGRLLLVVPVHPLLRRRAHDRVSGVAEPHAQSTGLYAQGTGLYAQGTGPCAHSAAAARVSTARGIKGLPFPPCECRHCTQCEPCRRPGRKRAAGTLDRRAGTRHEPHVVLRAHALLSARRQVAAARNLETLGAANARRANADWGRFNVRGGTLRVARSGRRHALCARDAGTQGPRTRKHREREREGESKMMVGLGAPAALCVQSSNCAIHMPGRARGAPLMNARPFLPCALLCASPSWRLRALGSHSRHRTPPAALCRQRHSPRRPLRAVPAQVPVPVPALA